MGTINYVADNPYRLLGIGSGTLQSELDQALSIVEGNLPIGLYSLQMPVTPLNPEALKFCSTSIQRMGQDPVSRTFYRLFWPLFYHASPSPDDVDGDLSWLETNSPIAPDLMRKQIHFLRSWNAFILTPSLESTQQAINSFRVFHANSELTGYLIDLLQQEAINFTQATSIVTSSLAQASQCVLDTITQQAAAFWSIGDVSSSLSLIQAITQSGLPKETIVHALNTLAPCGRDEEAKLIASTGDCMNLLMKVPAIRLPGTNLSLLSEAVRGYLPESERWAVTSFRCLHTIAATVREAATVLAYVTEEPLKAQSLFDNLLAHPLPEEIAQQLRAELTQLQQNIAKGPSGLYKPTRKAPWLSTVNGVGFKIYGRTPCPERPGWHYVTHYIVFLFLPIAPTSRYLVADAPGGGWYFFGRAPLTPFGRVHQIISGIGLLLFTAFILFAMTHTQPNDSNPTYPSYNSHSSPYTSNPSFGTVSTPNQQRRADLDRLNAEIYSENQDLDKRSAQLDQKEAELKTLSKHLDNSNRKAVSAYNKKIDQLEEAGKKYNKDVASYNAKIKQATKLEKSLRSSSP